MTHSPHGAPQDVASPRAEDDDGTVGGIPGGPGIGDGGDAGAGAGVGGVGGVEEVGNAGVDMNSALAEARLLSEAVLGHQNRSNGINDGDAESEENRFPCFFIVTATGSVEVRTAPSTTSPFVRTLNKVRIRYQVNGRFKTVDLKKV